MEPLDEPVGVDKGEGDPFVPEEIARVRDRALGGVEVPR